MHGCHSQYGYGQDAFAGFRLDLAVDPGTAGIGMFEQDFFQLHTFFVQRRDAFDKLHVDGAQLTTLLFETLHPDLLLLRHLLAAIRSLSRSFSSFSRFSASSGSRPSGLLCFRDADIFLDLIDDPDTWLPRRAGPFRLVPAPLRFSPSLLWSEDGPRTFCEVIEQGEAGDVLAEVKWPSAGQYG